MNEIEKMYKNAKVETLPSCCDVYCGTPTKKCKGCSDYREVYPLFTAEKQLEITKFIGLHYGFQMLKNEAFDYIIATKIFVKYELEYKGYGYGYDEAIANLVNNLWHFLTAEEKQQIREILSE